MKKTLALGVLGLLLVSVAAPLALSAPHDDRKGPRERAHERAEHVLPGHHAKGRHAFNISVDASGLGSDNESYTITGTGQGLAKVRAKDANLSRLAGFATIHLRLLDANGTLIKEGDARVRLQGFENATGEWKWRLVSVAKTPSGVPRLFLRGENVTRDGSVATLEGAGFAFVKPDEDKRLRIWLDDASVRIERA